MKSAYEKLLKLSSKDPKLFGIAAKSILNIIELAASGKEYAEVKAEFKHSQELYRAEALLDEDLNKKGAALEEMMNLVLQVGLHLLTK